MSRWRWWLAFLMVAGPASGAAQQAAPGLPEYTDRQRWGRAAGLSLSQLASEVELGRSRGMSVDEIGQWLGEYYARTWAGGLDARQLATSLRWNFLSDPNARVEMVTFTDTLVVMRAVEPRMADFGPDRRYANLTLDEMRRIYGHINAAIAAQVGVRLEVRYEGDTWVGTFRNGYEMPRASDAVRWGRLAYVERAMTAEIIRSAKAAGRTPREAGLAAAKAWESGWAGTDTPWRLFRGFAWNNYAEPEFHCDVLSATTAQVRARCSRPWVAMVRANERLLGVTVDEYEAFQLAVEQGIAASLGMTWEVQMDGDVRVVTARRR